MTKICTSCRVLKPDVDFYTKRSRCGTPYLASICKGCHLFSTQTRKSALRDDARDRAMSLLRGARKRATDRNIPFTLSLGDVLPALTAGRCQVTGIEFGGGRAYGPSIDQKVPGAGYTPANTQVVCWMYNAAKGAGSHEDVIRLAEALHVRAA